MDNFAGNNMLWIAIVVTAFTSAITLVLIALIWLFRWLFNAEQLSYSQFSKEWFPILACVIVGDQAPVAKKLNRSEKLILLRLWNYWHQSVSGNANIRLKQFVNDMGCTDVAIHMVQKGNRAQKLLSSISLGNLKVASAWQDLKALVATDDQIVSLHAARAMLQVDAEKAIKELLPMILGRAQWDMSVLTQILQQSRVQFEFEVIDSWADLSRAQQVRALKLCANLSLPLTHDLVHQLLQADQHTDIVLVTLQLLERLQNPVYRQPLLQLFDHASASVRAQAVKTHGAIADVSDIETLVDMLHDSDAATRYFAAFTLVQPTSLGLQRLTLLKDELEDARAYEAVAAMCTQYGAAA